MEFILHFVQLIQLIRLPFINRSGSKTCITQLFIFCNFGDRQGWRSVFARVEQIWWSYRMYLSSSKTYYPITTNLLLHSILAFYDLHWLGLWMQLKSFVWSSPLTEKWDLNVSSCVWLGGKDEILGAGAQLLFIEKLDSFNTLDCVSWNQQRGCVYQYNIDQGDGLTAA